MAHNMLQETKAQFARDDPAFLVLLAFWLVISSVGCFFLSLYISLSRCLYLSFYLVLSLSSLSSTTGVLACYSFKYFFLVVSFSLALSLLPF